MDSPAPPEKNGMPFRSPNRFLSDIDTTTIGRLISAGADVALMIEGGIIKDIAVNDADYLSEGYTTKWRGKPWRETVTPESRNKIDEMLKSPSDAGRWRQVNHLANDGAGIPINYLTVKTGGHGQYLALGRDLRSLSRLQQRLVDTHQELEREYAHLRDAEARYRHLFDSISEPIVIFEAATGRISEVNAAAKTFMASADHSRLPKNFSDVFLRKHEKQLALMVDNALATGTADSKALQLKSKQECHVRMSAFRQSDSVFISARFNAPQADQGDPSSGGAREIHTILQHLPDGLVITTDTLRVLSVNPAFLRMIRIADERQVIGENIGNWIGGPPTDLSMLMSNLKHHQVARNFSTVIRDSIGAEEKVEISAVATSLSGEQAYGFAIRNISRRLAASEGVDSQLPNSRERIASMVGKLPLKDIVRQSTDVIERLCIETALDIADQSRASAAEILGLSRQGLYSKLNRFGLDAAD